jgi:hypothetical protein
VVCNWEERAQGAVGGFRSRAPLVTNPQLRTARGATAERAGTLATRASWVPRATSRVIPATGKRRNPPPQQQQGRPYLRTHVRTRDVACVMTRHVPSARGARALLEPSDVPRSARQDEQREGAGDRRTEITTPRAWMCGLADLDADRKARSDGRRDDHEGQLTNRGVNPDDPALGRAMRWVGNPWALVRDPLSCQWHRRKERERAFAFAFRLPFLTAISMPNAPAKRCKRRESSWSWCCRAVVRSCGRAVVRSCGRAVVYARA